MPMTRTRTRTQTALNSIVEALARVKGEEAHLRKMLEARATALQGGAPDALAASIERRLLAVTEQREAIELTLKHFDQSLPIGRIAPSDVWLKAHGRGKKALRNYESKLLSENN